MLIKLMNYLLSVCRPCWLNLLGGLNLINQTKKEPCTCNWVDNGFFVDRFSVYNNFFSLTHNQGQIPFRD